MAKPKPKKTAKKSAKTSKKISARRAKSRRTATRKHRHLIRRVERPQAAPAEPASAEIVPATDQTRQADFPGAEGTAEGPEAADRPADDNGDRGDPPAPLDPNADRGGTPDPALT